MANGIQAWFGIKVDCFVMVIMIVLYVVVILAKDGDPILLAMLITSITSIQESLMWSLKCFMQVHNKMVNGARCIKMIDTP